MAATARHVAHGVRRAVTTAGREALELAACSRAAFVGTEVAATPRSIFVLRNNDIGDLLAVTPLFAALRRRFPAATIAAGVGDWAADVLRLNPYVDDVIAVNAPFFNKYTARGAGSLQRVRYLHSSPEMEALRAKGFDVGIDVLGSSWGTLLLVLAGIPLRLAVRGYAGRCRAAQRTVPFDPEEHVSATALRLGILLGTTAPAAPTRPQLFLSSEEVEEAERWWRGRSAAENSRVVVAPGGGLPEKCWPRDSWAGLLQGLDYEGRTIALLGGPAERGLLAELARAASHVQLPEETRPLRPTFALVATCDLVVCSSSMLLHVAAAFSKPTIVLLGDAFPSTRQHDLQWGYPGTCRTLGKELPGHPHLATVGEAITAIESARLDRRPTAVNELEHH